MSSLPASPPTSWTMPRGVLRMIAVLLALVAVAAFVLGILSAPPKARLPGERAASGTDTTPAVDAIEATPLSQERIEGPPPPPELTPEEKAKLEAEKKAKAEADAAAKAEAEAAAANPAQPAPAATPATPQDRVGDVLEAVTPPPSDDPPH